MKGRKETTNRIMKPGQDLVAAGAAGLKGTKALTAGCFAQLSPWFSRSYLENILKEPETDLLQYKDLLKDLGAGEMELAGEGGILKAIWDLTGACRVGAEFSLRRIPIKQETIEICERLQVNPYRLFSSGCLVFAADYGGRIAEALEERGIPAAVIGRVTEGIARKIQGEETGYLERPREDELVRILGRCPA